MEIDFSTKEGRLAYRAITSYADYRASGWPKNEAIDAIVEDLKTMPYLNLSEKIIIDEMAKQEEVQKIIDAANRQPCPEHVAKELIEQAPSLYRNVNLRRTLAKKFYDDLSFPLFNEEDYGPIEKETRKKLRYL